MEKSTHTAEYAALRRELRDLRCDAGLSQRELAKRLRVPHSWVAKVESGERRIDVVEFCWFLNACSKPPLRVLGVLSEKISARAARRQKKRGRSA